MTTDTVLRDFTVVVRDGRVVAVGPAATATVPQAAQIVEGQGKFLIPGLADMHVHLLSDGDEVHDSADFVLLSVNPLTDIRNAAAIDGVAIGGMWMPRSQLDAMIARGAGAVRVAP